MLYNNVRGNYKNDGAQTVLLPSFTYILFMLVVIFNLLLLFFTAIYS